MFAATLFLPPLLPPKRRSFLSKQTYKRRWCVLNPKQFTLTSYKSERLQDATTYTLSKKRTVHENAYSGFELLVLTPGEGGEMILNCITETRAEMMEWVTAIVDIYPAAYAKTLRSDASTQIGRCNKSNHNSEVKAKHDIESNNSTPSAAVTPAANASLINSSYFSFSRKDDVNEVLSPSNAPGGSRDAPGEDGRNFLLPLDFSSGPDDMLDAVLKPRAQSNQTSLKTTYVTQQFTTQPQARNATSRSHPSNTTKRGEHNNVHSASFSVDGDLPKLIHTAYKRGYLFGGSSTNAEGLLNSKYTTRYVYFLTAAHLIWAEDYQHSTALDHICLDLVTTSCVSQEDSSEIGIYRFGLDVYHSPTVITHFNFACTTELEKKEWFTAIEDAMLDNLLNIKYGRSCDCEPLPVKRKVGIHPPENAKSNSTEEETSSKTIPNSKSAFNISFFDKTPRTSIPTSVSFHHIRDRNDSDTEESDDVGVPAISPRRDLPLPTISEASFFQSAFDHDDEAEESDENFHSVNFGASAVSTSLSKCLINALLGSIYSKHEDELP